MYHLCEMAIAYGIVLFLPTLVDFMYESETEVMLIGWLNIGLIVMAYENDFVEVLAHKQRILRRYLFEPTPFAIHVSLCGTISIGWKI